MGVKEKVIEIIADELGVKKEEVKPGSDLKMEFGAANEVYEEEVVEG